MQTSMLERAMVQNAYTEPLRHEQLGFAPFGHACSTPHSHTMGATFHSNLGTGIGASLIGGAILIGYLATEKSPMRNKFIKTVGLATAAFAAGGAAQRY